MSTQTRLLRLLPAFAVVVVLCIAGVLVYFLQGWFEAPAKTKKMVQQVSLIAPPPPPPPPKVDKPPEPKVKEEVDIPEPENIPDDIPDSVADDLPPAGDMLGLDADGGVGGDGFGLLARKGGRDFLAGVGDKAAKRQYGRTVKNDIQDFLSNIDEIRKSDYEIKIKFWFDDSGNVLNFELLESTGNKKLDEKMRTTLAGYNKLPSAPPNRKANSITLQIVSRI